MAVVVLLGGERRRLDVPRGSLPMGVREGDWLQLELEDGRVTAASIDVGEIERVRKRISEKLLRLRRGEHLKPPPKPE